MSRKSESRTIGSVIVQYSTVLALLVLFTLSLVHILLEIKDLSIEAINKEEEFLEMKKEQLRLNVENSVSTIHILKNEYAEKDLNIKQVQERAIAVLQKLNYNDSDYIFAGTWEGVSLLGPVEGQNVIEVTDINGTKIVKELIETSKSGGGFVEYVMPKLDDKKSGLKLSYVTAIEDWGWYIGSGTYIDEIELIINEKKQKLIDNVIKNIMIMLSTSIAVFYFSSRITKNISLRISKSIQEFTDFFKKVEHEKKKIEIENIYFNEFKQIAMMVNDMLDKRMKGEIELHESEIRYKKVFEASLSGLWEMDLDNHTFYFSETWRNMFGYDIEGRRDFNWTELIHPDDYYMVMKDFDKLLKNKRDLCDREFRIKNSNGEYRWIEAKGISIKDTAGNVKRIIGSHTDIHTKKEQAQKIWNLAYYDDLTKLPNRLLFRKVFEDVLSLCKENLTKGSIFYIDIDNFQNINNLYGQNKGDEALVEIGKRLNAISISNSLLGRISGDEFVLMVHGFSINERLLSIGNLLVKVFESPFSMDDNNHVYITCSIGIAIFPDHGETVDEILGNANTAVQKAKELGKNRYCMYDKVLSKKMKKKILIESCLKKAVLNNEFELFYQPQIEFKTGRIIGFEALLRWPYFKHGEISPVEFIPIAEESGQILAIGNWVLREACVFSKEINRKSKAPLIVSVNISAIQLLQYNFVDNILDIVKEEKVNPKTIGIELTETSILSTFEESSVKLKHLMDYGIKVYLDDFGMGYSSLNYLRNLPIQGIKIDKSFISENDKDIADETIIKTIISLADSLNLTTFAEGIETEAQMSLLKAYGCHFAQGFLFGKPLPPSKVIEILDKEMKHQ